MHLLPRSSSQQQYGWFAAALVLGALMAFLSVGCGGPNGDDDDEYRPRKRQQAGPQAFKVEKLKAFKAEGGQTCTIKGKVTYEGTPPTPEELAQKFAALVNKEVSYCLQGIRADGKQTPVQSCEKEDQSLRVGTNNQLGNVFVWIEPPDKHYFEVPQDQLDKLPKQVVMGQPHCAFVPHCAVVFPYYYKDGDRTPTGQDLVVENDAYVAHNAKFEGGRNTADEGLGAKSDSGAVAKVVKRLQPYNGPVTLSCTIHPWMKGYIRAYEHPYAAVTSVGAGGGKYEDRSAPNFGTFEIKGAPRSGTKLRLKAWHEKLDWITPKEGIEVTLDKDVIELPPLVAKPRG